MANNINLVCLRGGLGNQLFQYSYARKMLGSKALLRYIPDLGHPNTNVQGLPELFELVLPNLSTDILTSESWLLSKILNYSLRKRSQSEVNVMVRILEFTGSILLFFKFREIFVIDSGMGIGFNQNPPSAKRRLVNGYFQSYRWVDLPSLKKEIQILDSKDSKFSEFFIEAEKKRILAMHVRLGDYALFEEFGILSATYYEKALETLNASDEYDSIWLFSNDIENARKYVPQQYAHLIHEIPCHLSSVETLQIMRLAHGYIIANSTFSWWGAMLSNTLNPPVIAPTPWFKEMHEPLHLIPPSWKRINSWEK